PARAATALAPAGAHSGAGAGGRGSGGAAALLAPSAPLLPIQGSGDVPTAVRIALLFTALALAPTVLLMMTSFVRMVIVLHFVPLARVAQPKVPADLPMQVVVPSFVLSELRASFQIGFLIFLPFLVIDLVVSAVLLSSGMMMLPPVVVSFPFKVLLFVLVDGWYLLVGSLV